MDYLFYLIIITVLLASAQFAVHSAYSKYARVETRTNKSGLEVVNDMQMKYGLTDLAVYKIHGELTDHYDPRSKSISLSSMNYNSATVAGIAVAAHEMGHAIQDKEGYFFLRLRCGMGKLTIVASNLSWIVIYLGFLMWYTPLIIAGIALFGVTVFFDLITLPVEMNASKRAFEYLKSTGEYSDEELSGVNKVLKAAAFTYIASTLAGAIQLIRLIGILKSDD